MSEIVGVWDNPVSLKFSEIKELVLKGDVKDISSDKIQFKTNIGSGLGVFWITIKSHRKYKQVTKIFEELIYRAYGTSISLPNTQETIEKLSELKIKVSKSNEAWFVSTLPLANSDRKYIKSIMNILQWRKSFTQNKIDEIFDEYRMKVSHMRDNILVIGTKHFHFSEYMPVIVIDIVDDNFSKSIENYNELYQMLNNELQK